MTALTDDVYDLWVSTLKKLVAETADRAVSDVTPCEPDMLWIRQLWPAGVKTVDMPTAVGLCKQIGLVIPDALRQAFKVCTPRFGVVLR